MAIVETEAVSAITSAGFVETHRTVKLIEYTSAKSGRILYLRLGQGFPDHADIIINPEVPVSALFTIAGVRANPRNELRFGSNMRKFPKAPNKGEEPEHYGRFLQANTIGALSKLCQSYAALP